MDIGIALEQYTDTSLGSTVQTRGGNVYSGPITSFPNTLDFVLVDGWDAVRRLRTHDITAPVLAIENPPGLGPVAVDQLGDAIDALHAETYSVTSHATLSVQYQAEDHHAVAQAMLMTQTPASISEYAMYHDDTQVGRYRADGMAIATPTGSSEYAHSAGGPLLSPTVGGIVVVPIAPYRTNPDHWVLDSTISFEVLRQGGDVRLFLDGNEVTAIDPNERITIEQGAPISGLQVPQSQSPFWDRDSP